MTTELTEVLDSAVQELAAGRTIESILSEYPKEAAALKPLLDLAAILSDGHTVPQLDAEAVHADRQAFVFKVGELSAARHAEPGGQAVSTPVLVRLKRWMQGTFGFLEVPKMTKERRPMTAFAFKLMLILGVAFGSLGGTAAAAANSLPDSALYPVKMTMEQTRLTLTRDPAHEAELHLAYALERAQEVQKMAERGRVADEQLVTRLQEHLTTAMNLAAELPDEAMSGLLRRTRQMIQAEQHGLTELQLRVTERARERLQQVDDELARIDDEATLGLSDPMLFRWRHTANRPEDAPTQPEMTPGPPVSTPMGGNQHQFGPPTEQPGPGGPGGNPDCPGCDPPGDQNQNQEQGQNQNGEPPDDPSGPGPNPDGTGQHGGSTDSPANGNDAAGGQNQNGNGQSSSGGQSGNGK
jgi:hypothetical protein